MDEISVFDETIEFAAEASDGETVGKKRGRKPAEKLDRDFSGFRCYIANTRLANFLRQTRSNQGVHTLEVSGRSSKANIRVKYNMISNEPLTFFDCAVMDAVLTFYANDILDFNVRGLLKLMYGRNDITISPILHTKICDTLNKLKETEMIIDITEECRMRDIDKEKLNGLVNLMSERDRGFEYVRNGLTEMFGAEETSARTMLWGSLLPLEERSKERTGEQKTKNRIKWRITRAPLLYEYGEKIANQRIRYAWQLQEQITDEKEPDTENRMLIKYYLIHHLEVLRYLLNSGSERANRQRRIRLYNLRDPDIGIIPRLGSKSAEPEKDKRADDSPYFARKLRSTCKEIERVLKHFQKLGYIGQYEKRKGPDGLIVYDITGYVKDIGAESVKADDKIE